MLKHILVAAAAAAAITVQAESQVPGPTYADLAAMALPAPVVAHVRTQRASRLKPAEAAGVPAGRTRFYIEAEVASLIRGAGGISSSVRFLADLPNQPNGKPAKVRKGTEWLIVARPVPNRPGELQLLGRDAPLPYQPATADRLRAILTEASQAGAPPEITGIGKAFHVPGSLPGESETQIFLQTAERRPVSLNILRRPGEAPRWSVALAEIVDEAASAPARDTLLWFRLACTLPSALPAQSLADAGPEEAAAIRADYGLVLAQLGPCTRSRSRA